MINKDRLQLIATATFGLEAVVRREIEGLGYVVLKTEDGKVTYEGDVKAIAESNLWLRTADRVLLKMAEFDAVTFEELFQQTKAVAWSDIIPKDGKFTVTCSTVKSTLHNPPAIQSIAKKAIVEQMKEVYGIDVFPETGAEYTVKVTMLKDRATLTIDTSGSGLHNRGYRVAMVDAPMKETLAAALVQLSFWKPGTILLDPCCGSGTIPIEAAMIQANIAPGLNRHFASEKWDFIGSEVWKSARHAAYNATFVPGYNVTQNATFQPGTNVTFLTAGDVNPKAVAAAKANAEAAGVDELITFRRADIRESLNNAEGEQGIIVTNPPYGERIGEDEEIERIYKSLANFMKKHDDWSLFMITSDKEVEKRVFRRKADRRRKLYNGNIETTYYQFHGKKPGVKK